MHDHGWELYSVAAAGISSWNPAHRKFKHLTFNSRKADASLASVAGVIHASRNCPSSSQSKCPPFTENVRVPEVVPQNCCNRSGGTAATRFLSAPSHLSLPSATIPPDTESMIPALILMSPPTSHFRRPKACRHAGGVFFTNDLSVRWIPVGVFPGTAS